VSIGNLWSLDLLANLSYQISSAHPILAKLKKGMSVTDGVGRPLVVENELQETMKKQKTIKWTLKFGPKEGSKEGVN